DSIAYITRVYGSHLNESGASSFLIVMRGPNEEMLLPLEAYRNWEIDYELRTRHPWQSWFEEPDDAAQSKRAATVLNVGPLTAKVDVLIEVEGTAYRQTLD